MRPLAPDGSRELSEGQELFLTWLTGGRPEGQSQEQFAAQLGVHVRTLRDWKKDPSFLKAWELRMRQTHARPDVLSAQLEVLNEKALTGDVRATELYWKLVDKMTPEKVEVKTESGLSDLSDAQLDELIGAHARKEQQKRHLRAVE